MDDAIPQLLYHDASIPRTPPPVYDIPNIDDFAQSPRRRQPFPREGNDDHVFGYVADEDNEEENGFVGIELDDLDGAGNAGGYESRGNLVIPQVAPPAYGVGLRNARARNILYPPMPERRRNRLIRYPRVPLTWRQKVRRNRIIIWSAAFLFLAAFVTWVIVYVIEAEKNDQKSSNNSTNPSSTTSTQRMSTEERFMYPTSGFTKGGDFITDEQFSVYTGQDLTQLASKYNIPLSELLTGNPSISPNAKLTFGQIIWIPTGSSQGYQALSDTKSPSSKIVSGSSELSIASDPGAVSIIPVKSSESNSAAKPPLTSSAYGEYQATTGGIKWPTGGFETGGEFKGKEKKGKFKWPTLGILTTGADFKKNKERSATTEDAEFSILPHPHPDNKEKPRRGRDTLIIGEVTTLLFPYDTKIKQTLNSGPTPLPAWVAKRSMDENILKTRCEDRSPIGRYNCVLNSLLNIVTASQIQKLFPPITETMLTMETLLINGLTEISKANGWNEMPDRVLDMRYERVLILVQDAMQGLRALLDKKAAALDWRGIETAISDLEAGRRFELKEIMGVSSNSVGFLNVAINEAISKLEELVRWQSELEDVITKRFALMNEWIGDCFERRKQDALSGRYAHKRASKVAKEAKEWVEVSSRREDCELRQVQKLLNSVKLVVGWLTGEETKVANVYKLLGKKENKKYGKKNFDVAREVEALWELHRAVRGEFEAGYAAKEMVDGWKIAEDEPCKFRQRDPVCGNV